jgi:hypothetical protein
MLYKMLKRIIHNTNKSPTIVNETSNFVVVTYWWGRGNKNNNTSRPCIDYYESISAPLISLALSALNTSNKNKITFDKATGTGGSDNVTATFDAAMPTATAPTRSGHTFGGYFTLANGGGVQYYSSTMVSLRNWDIDAATTLIAKWTAN